jgi:hypothetical protein
MKQAINIRSVLAFLVLTLLLIAPPLTALSFASEEPGRRVHDAALRLVQFCNHPGADLDERDVATLVDYVLGPKTKPAHVLPESAGCPGAYHEFDTRIPFSRFMAYSYNAMIPQAVTRPSSLRFSLWRNAGGASGQMPGSWKPLAASERPLIFHGFQRDSNTPDLTTGVYYEYDLKRTLILAHHKGRQVLFSISKQIDRSRVGEKGFILGHDSDWNYFYSGEPGSAKAGLGWVKSYISDYFSVGVYVESGTAPIKVRTGVFQWIKAGWSGINFVKPDHIIEGMKRFARSNRMILESPRLPAPNQMIAAYQWLCSLPESDLTNKYEVLQQARQSSALETGKIGKAKADKPIALDKIPKEQMLEELMLEYLKLVMGKPTPLERHFAMSPSAL